MTINLLTCWTSMEILSSVLMKTSKRSARKNWTHLRLDSYSVDVTRDRQLQTRLSKLKMA
jgi:hypothetical protein